jgi:hypothetical protein
MLNEHFKNKYPKTLAHGSDNRFLGNLNAETAKNSSKVNLFGPQNSNRALKNMRLRKFHGSKNWPQIPKM